MKCVNKTPKLSVPCSSTACLNAYKTPSRMGDIVWVGCAGSPYGRSAAGLHFPAAPGRGGRRVVVAGRWPGLPGGSMAAREAGGVVLGKAAEKLFSLSGLFAVYKPKGLTSAGVLNLLKEKLLAGRRRARAGGGQVQHTVPEVGMETMRES